MKALIVFYSRTGITKKTAEAIAAAIPCEAEEIIDKTDRSGIKGWLLGGKHAWKSTLTEIGPMKSSISSYDLVIIGTPVWAFTMTPAVRTFIEQNKDKIRKVAFLTTEGGSGHEKTFKAMAEALGKQPVATLNLLEKEVKAGKDGEKTRQFVQAVKNLS
jgi:flavodoxin